MKQLQYFHGLVKKALESDGSGSPQALLDYLVSIKEIADSLIVKHEEDELFSNESEKLIRLLSQCTERLDAVYQEKRSKLNRASSGPNLSLANRLANGDSPQQQGKTLATVCDPLNKAAQENMRLYCYHRSKIASGRLTAAEVATMNMNLQRKMLENLEVTKQQKNYMERLREKRKLEISEELSNKMGNSLSEEKREFMVEIAAFEEEVPELRLFTQTLRETPTIDLAASYVRALLEYIDHPISIKLRDSRSKLLVKLHRMLENCGGALHDADTTLDVRPEPEGIALADEDGKSLSSNSNAASNCALLADLSDAMLFSSIVKRNSSKHGATENTGNNLIDFDGKVLSYCKTLNDTLNLVPSDSDFQVEELSDSAENAVAPNGETADQTVANLNKSCENLALEQSEDSRDDVSKADEGLNLRFIDGDARRHFPTQRQPSQVDRDIQALAGEIRVEITSNCDMLMQCSTLRELTSEQISEMERLFVEDFCETTIRNFHFTLLYGPLLKMFRFKTEREQRCLRLCESSFRHLGLRFLGLEEVTWTDVSDQYVERFLTIIGERNLTILLNKYDAYITMKKFNSKNAPLDYSRKDILLEYEDWRLFEGFDCVSSIQCYNYSNADDLVSYLCITILKAAQPGLLVPVLAIVENFIPEKKLISEEGYCLTATVTAIRYMISLIEQKNIPD